MKNFIETLICYAIDFPHWVRELLYSIKDFMVSSFGLFIHEIFTSLETSLKSFDGVKDSK